MTQEPGGILLYTIDADRLLVVLIPDFKKRLAGRDRKSTFGMFQG
jgi:hypothetical protein